jgi:hypothetical protein
MVGTIKEPSRLSKLLQTQSKGVIKPLPSMIRPSETAQPATEQPRKQIKKLPSMMRQREGVQTITQPEIKPQSEAIGPNFDVFVNVRPGNIDQLLRTLSSANFSKPQLTTLKNTFEMRQTKAITLDDWNPNTHGQLLQTVRERIASFDGNQDLSRLNKGQLMTIIRELGHKQTNNNLTTEENDRLQAATRLVRE